jgi:hypothetical protein
MKPENYAKSMKSWLPLEPSWFRFLPSLHLCRCCEALGFPAVRSKHQSGEIKSWLERSAASWIKKREPPALVMLGHSPALASAYV